MLKLLFNKGITDDDDIFLMTYGDGLSNIDIGKLVEFHRGHGKLATLTAVRPPSRFGGLAFDGDRITQFIEKPPLGEGWINGGYFVLNRRVLDYIADDSTSWERSPLERLVREGLTSREELVRVTRE